MNDLNAKTLNSSQAEMLYPKRQRAKAVMNMDRLFGRECPRFDVTIDKPSIKDYVSELLCHCQRFVGRHRCLWWVIELLGKGK